VELSDLANVEWLEPWTSFRSEGFQEELRNEVNSKHPLSGRQAITVGRRIDCDDVLFFLPDNPDPLAVVHLTWRMKTESDSRWPSTSFFRSLDDWIENCMNPDHRDYATADLPGPRPPAKG
jgi:hypothetical protein